MKDSRIMLAIKKKLGLRQNEAKVKRLRKGIEVALANAEESAARAEDALDSLVENFNVDSDVQEFLEKVSDALYDKDEANQTIEQLHRISAYLFEEVEIADDSGEQ